MAGKPPPKDVLAGVAADVAKKLALAEKTAQHAETVQLTNTLASVVAMQALGDWMQELADVLVAAIEKKGLLG